LQLRNWPAKSLVSRWKNCSKSNHEGQAEISRRQAETRSLNEASFRSTAYLVVFLLLVILILALALIDPQLLENIGQVFRWAPK